MLPVCLLGVWELWGDTEVEVLGPLPRMCLARHLVAEAHRREESLSTPEDPAQGWAGFPSGSNLGR